MHGGMRLNSWPGRLILWDPPLPPPSIQNLGHWVGPNPTTDALVEGRKIFALVGI